MPSTARKALVSLLIALHAAIMLCGPGLHAATGLGHLGATEASSRPDRAPDQITTVSSAVEHCPLCDFLAQGQLPIDPEIVVADRMVDPVDPASPPLSPPAPSLLSTQSRAPPRRDARIVLPTNPGSNLLHA